MRWSLGIALAFASALVSCSSGAAMIALVHPVTQDVRICNYDTVGNLSLIGECAKMWESLGYKRADTLTEEERERLLPGIRAKPQRPAVY